MTSHTPGRNDPCPCGSGRKYKQCCLAVRQARDAVRLRWRGAEGRVVPALFEFALELGGRDFFFEAWNEFFDCEHVPPDIETTPEFDPMFMHWFVFSFVADPNLPDHPSNWPTEPIGRQFLWAHGSTLPEDDRRFIERACRSPLSAFAVLGAQPGQDIHLRDIMTGREFHVIERTASTDTFAGSLLFTCVVSFDDGAVMCGGSPYLIPPTWHTWIISARERMVKKRLFSTADLFEYDIEIRGLYHQIAHALTHPAPPRLNNTDGDPFELTTLTFELACTPASAFERLKSLTLSDDDDDLLAQADRDEHGELRGVSLSWLKKGNRTHRHWDNTVLGRMELAPGRLTAEVNSRKRATRLKREVTRRLGNDARLTGSTVADINELADRMRREQPDAAGESPELQEAAALVQAQLWDDWLDERVPALNNKTPRQAARTTDGRERLEALLSEFAWRNEGQPPHQRVDVAALRRKLGLPDPSRQAE